MAPSFSSFRNRSTSSWRRIGLAVTFALAGVLAVTASSFAADSSSKANDSREPVVVTFEKLSSFPYVVVDSGTGATDAEIEVAKKRDQIPAPIRDYDRKRVALTGYMLPLKLEKGLAKSFILMKDVSTCCYGASPKMNEYLVVTMKDKGIEPIQDIPVVVVGTFQISEQYEGGFLTSVFQMEGLQFLGPAK
jgi:hypothetical protein